MGSSSEPTKSGTEDIKGIVNLLGNVNGDANGLINFGEASPDDTGSGLPTEGGDNCDTKAKAVNDLAGAVRNLDDSQNAPATGRKIRGLINMTEEVVGNGNGGINFGNLKWGDSAKKGSKIESAK